MAESAALSAAGLSQSRLARLRGGLARYMERGEVTGVAALVSRRGATHVEILGWQDRERRAPMQRDTLFRIASLTKPITAAAAMILVEEGRIGLDEPLDGWLPELATRRVLRHIDAPLEDTRPAWRALTLRDLLTFRLGFGMLIGPTDYPIQRAIMQLQLWGRKPWPPHSPDEWLRRLGTLPLMYQPGERWLYHIGAEVLGVLIARVAGQSFEAFLRERLFDPLGMHDTGFWVPPAKLGRFASCYQSGTAAEPLAVFDEARDSQWSRPPPFPSGGSGLISTLDDYAAFAAMMLSQGRCGSQRILARPTVQAMTSDQLSPEQKALSVGFFPGFWDTRGWGLGLSVNTRCDGPARRPGRFGWDGVYGTSWYSDPAEDLTAILMIQRLDFAPTNCGINADFHTLVYQAIED
jgi:CubicO group peptidase (beta-lactamase class C family)